MIGDDGAITLSIQPSANMYAVCSHFYFRALILLSLKVRIQIPISHASRVHIQSNPKAQIKFLLDQIRIMNHGSGKRKFAAEEPEASM